ncbi:MAG: hypothetical protein ACRDDJ_02040 [[Mycobacterium] stephanolepidis]
MFEEWHDPDGVEILKRVDRRVIVDTTKVWPSKYWGPAEPGNTEGIRPMQFASHQTQTHGLRIETLQEGRQIAWIKRSFGEYLGLVFIKVGSADGCSKLTMPLWIQGDAFRLPRSDGS